MYHQIQYSLRFKRKSMSAIQKLLSEKGKPMITHLAYTYTKQQ